MPFKIARNDITKVKADGHYASADWMMKKL